MSSRHRGWQRRWTLDLTAAQARHESGLVVEFGGGAGQAANAGTILSVLLLQHGPHNAPRMLTRLVREAAQLYAEARHAGP